MKLTNYLSPVEISKLTKQSRSTVLTHIYNGRISKVIKFNNRYIVPTVSANKYILDIIQAKAVKEREQRKNLSEIKEAINTTLGS